MPFMAPVVCLLTILLLYTGSKLSSTSSRWLRLKSIFGLKHSPATLPPPRDDFSLPSDKYSSMTLTEDLPRPAVPTHLLDYAYSPPNKYKEVRMVKKQDSARDVEATAMRQWGAAKRQCGAAKRQ